MRSRGAAAAGGETPAKLEYKDESQVRLDVSRVAVSKAGRAKLERRIATVLAANPALSYYQGFHDIAQHSHTTKQLENLALQQLRDFMSTSLVPTTQVLHLVPELMVAADADGLGRLFRAAPPESRRALGYFAIAPVITLFSHDCSDSVVITRIIRTVLKEGLAYVLYLYVALFLEYRTEFLDGLSPSSDDDEIDMAVQGVAASLTAQNYDAVDRRARRLRSRHALRTLPSWPKISRYSVLKTGKVTKRSTALYTLGQLEKSPQGGTGILGSLNDSAPKAAFSLAVAMGAVAAGMVWTRFHSK